MSEEIPGRLGLSLEAELYSIPEVAYGDVYMCRHLRAWVEMVIVPGKSMLGVLANLTNIPPCTDPIPERHQQVECNFSLDISHLHIVPAVRLAQPPK